MAVQDDRYWLEFLLYLKRFFNALTLQSLFGLKTHQNWGVCMLRSRLKFSELGLFTSFMQGAHQIDKLSALTKNGEAQSIRSLSSSLC